MSENRALGRIFGPKRDEVTGEWSKLHNEELNDLYCSPNIVRVIKSRRMRWAGHVARMGRRRGMYRGLVRKLRERDHMEDPGIDGRIILRWTFKKSDDLAQDSERWRALVNAVMNLQFQQNAGNFLTSSEQVSFSRRTLLHGVSK